MLSVGRAHRNEAVPLRILHDVRQPQQKRQQRKRSDSNRNQREGDTERDDEQKETDEMSNLVWRPIVKRAGVAKLVQKRALSFEETTLQRQACRQFRCARHSEKKTVKKNEARLLTRVQNKFSTIVEKG